MLFDSHAHLNFEDFNSDWQAVAKDCLDHDIWVVNVGAQFATSKKGIAMAEQFAKGMYASVALHPIHVAGSKFHPETFTPDEYAKLIESSAKVVAVGETGIDFFHNNHTFTKQKEVFWGHIALAAQYQLPLIMHGRNSKDGGQNAYRVMLEILDQAKPTSGGVIHCFGGRVEEAVEFVKRGFYVGFTGIITFDKTGKLTEVIKKLPLDAILIETDCPFLAPEPYRGKRNQPQYVSLVAEKIAQLRDMSYNEIAEATSANAKKLFNIG